jgi:hypothetical protein
MIYVEMAQKLGDFALKKPPSLHKTAVLCRDGKMPDERDYLQ